MKIELHAHTCQVSPCSHVRAQRMIDLYTEKGYGAVVVTDHYGKWIMDRAKISDADEFTEYFLGGFRAAKRRALHTNGAVAALLGAEINLLEGPNDYLLYGVEEDFFYENPLLFRLSLKKLRLLCEKEGAILVQAHPYRGYCSPADPLLLDGLEAYNGNPRQKNNNDMAYEMASQYGLIMTSGSDFHEEEDAARGGIETKASIFDSQGLARTLRDGKYSLITSD